MEGLLIGLALGALLHQVVLPTYVRMHRRQIAQDLMGRRHRDR